MTPVTLTLSLMLGIGALFLAFIMLFLAVPAILNARSGVSETATGVRSSLNRMANDMKRTSADILGLQTGASMLLVRARALGSLTGTSPPESRPKVRAAVSATEARYTEFLNLLEEWSRMSSLRIHGAAASSRDGIVSLLQSAASAQGVLEGFAKPANNLVEYVVEATDAKFKQSAPPGVERALMRMLEIAGLECISPKRGAAWDVALHEVSGKVTHGENRPGTVAEVVVRGLRGGRAHAKKARVLLYDD